MVFFEEINHWIYVLKRGAKVITLPSEIIRFYTLKTLINYFKYFSQGAIIQAVILLVALPVIAQDRAVWVTAWDLNSPAKIDKMIDEMHGHGFNKIFVQSRYRGDALYIPNRMDSTYPNPESRCYLLDDDGFDPLAYTIEKAKPKGLKVYAWVTTFVATPHDLTKIDSSHVFYRHPEWF
ncbi:MAG: family 10 glycosylhydrolase, partial [Bacteroidales bacterium]|nr:family 10 glycosylhydrolase [Bacteroidales bacterium]